jgi:hypothetical protein
MIMIQELRLARIYSNRYDVTSMTQKYKDFPTRKSRRGQELHNPNCSKARTRSRTPSEWPKSFWEQVLQSPSDQPPQKSRDEASRDKASRRKVARCRAQL